MENTRFLNQKRAIERILKSEDGKYLIQYLGDITLPNSGFPCTGIEEYAFQQGQRSILITLLQICEKSISDFCTETIWDLIKLNERR